MKIIGTMGPGAASPKKKVRKPKIIKLINTNQLNNPYMVSTNSNQYIKTNTGWKYLSSPPQNPTISKPIKKKKPKVEKELINIPGNSRFIISESLKYSFYGLSNKKTKKNIRMDIYCNCKNKIDPECKVAALSNMLDGDGNKVTNYRVTLRLNCGNCKVRVSGQDYEDILVGIRLMYPQYF